MDNIDGARLIGDAKFAVRMLAHFHADSPRGPEVADVWRVVLKVLDSAAVEHQRLLGTDVAVAELQLRDTGSAAWRDLYDGSSDGETDGLTRDKETDDHADCSDLPTARG